MTTHYDIGDIGLLECEVARIEIEKDDVTYIVLVRDKNNFTFHISVRDSQISMIGDDL